MTSLLLPHENSKNKKRNSIKLNINCKERVATNPLTKDWLELTKKFDHMQSADLGQSMPEICNLGTASVRNPNTGHISDNYKIYTGLLDKRHNIVAKIGLQTLDEEYEIAKKLEILHLSTFIKFTCIFKCLDNFSKLSELTKEICKKEGQSITVLLMPYMSEGRIDCWKWDRSNFDIMKNVITHTFLSLLYAKKKIGFIHRDLHLGNVLMKKSSRATIDYGDFGTLEVLGYLPVIMDFEKSLFIEKFDRITFSDLIKFISLMSIQCNVTFTVTKLVTFLEKLVFEETTINVININKIITLINELQIRSVNSEAPPLPDWLKPKKV